MAAIGLDGLSVEELRKLRSDIDGKISEKMIPRRKELWENVIMAIAKYREETQEDIRVEEKQESFKLLLSFSTKPGTLCIAKKIKEG